MTTYKNKIGAADISHYDGVNRTFGRPTSSGGTLTLPKVGNVVDVLQVFGDGETPSEGALLTALQYVSGRTLELAPGTWPITANLTTGAVTFILRRGAVFSVDTAVTLDLSASYVIPEVETGWYTGAGTVTVTASRVLIPVDIAAHEADTTTHGATGAVVGTTNIQTLTNKTLTTPTIGDLSNMTHAHTSNATGGAITVDKVLVSANDTTAGYLNGKLVAGSGVTLTEGSDGGNETLTIAAAATSIGYGANSGTTTLSDGDGPDFFTIDCGTLAVNTLYLVSLNVLDCTKGGTAGLTNMDISKDSGSGVIDFNGITQSLVRVSQTQSISAANDFSLTAIMEVTTGGTVVLKFRGDSYGSDATVANGKAFARVVRI